MTELLAAKTFLRKNFSQGGRVLCAVSGGLDSMCLLEFMATQPGFSVAAAHFHHQLRDGFADRDQEFVEDWCRRRGIPLFTGTGDTRRLAAAEGRSIEEAARTLRYGFLEETAERHGFDAIFTAHHADDNAETMLLHLLRGTGTAGLAGIPPIRGRIYRPFLRISRERLEAYALRRGIPHVEDETNREDDASRNLLRHKVLPVLREINPGAVENMSATAMVLARENAAMEGLAQELAAELCQTESGLSIAREALLEAPQALAERGVLHLLSAAAGHRRDFTSAHVAAVLELAEQGREGAQVTLPYGLVAACRKNRLELTRPTLAEPALLPPNTPLRWGGYTLTLLEKRGGEGLALIPGTAPITVAPCPAGAFLTLPGASGGRSVKRLCLDRRIPLGERDALPAIYVGDRLAAVWRLGVDTMFLPEGAPCRFIQIQNETEERHDDEK